MTNPDSSSETDRDNEADSAESLQDISADTSSNLGWKSEFYLDVETIDCGEGENNNIWEFNFPSEYDPETDGTKIIDDEK